MKLDHIAIICSDRDASVEFYNVLGFEIIKEIKRPERNDILIMMQDADMTELELFVKAGCPKRLSYPEAYGLRHIAFRCENIEQIADRLKEKGYDPEKIRRDSLTGEKMTFAADPDGLPVEIRE